MEIYIKDHWLANPALAAIAHLRAAQKLLATVGAYAEIQELEKQIRELEA